MFTFILRKAPRSTLFPYTTLFRSNADSVPDTNSAADSVITFNEIMYHPVKDDPSGEWIELYNQMSINMDISNWRITGDRKSTRLNSSHTVISYAVFCLKKNKLPAK